MPDEEEEAASGNGDSETDGDSSPCSRRAEAPCDCSKSFPFSAWERDPPRFSSAVSNRDNRRPVLAQAARAETTLYEKHECLLTQCMVLSSVLSLSWGRDPPPLGSIA